MTSYSEHLCALLEEFVWISLLLRWSSASICKLCAIINMLFLQKLEMSVDEILAEDVSAFPVERVPNARASNIRHDEDDIRGVIFLF